MTPFMHDLLQALLHAFDLLLTGDRHIWAIITLSLRVSGSALLLASLLGLPLGAWLALGHFWGRRLLIILILYLTKVYFFRYTSSIKQNVLNMLWYNIKALAMNKYR